MKNLATSIRNYYYSHFDELPLDKQFHFVSRLGSWDNDPIADQTLCDLQSSFKTDSIKKDLAELITNPPEAKINAAERRAPYFKKYPQLRGYMLALFRVRHLFFHYDADARDLLLEIVPKDDLYVLSEALQKDTEAVAILSTYAINYIYLVEVILFPRSKQPLESFLQTIVTLGDTYGDSAEDSLLLIYLFTHCIIGASNFYQTKVSDTVYHKMLEKLEKTLEQHFDSINLDNKFEYLVCCRITDFATSLNERIEQEATASLSPEGTFLVDTVNHAAQSNKTSFEDSEHRNVLYIMSTIPFQK